MAKKKTKKGSKKASKRTGVVASRATGKKKGQLRRKKTVTATGEKRKYAAVEIRQGDYVMYSFKANARELWEIVQINRRHEDKQEGYQRALSVSRVKKIAKYIDAGNVLPGCIIVSFDNAEFSAATNMLYIPEQPDAGWVIDGQHRLAGAHEANADIEVFVLAFVQLELAEQINIFITVNREQKGVPASLYYDLLQHLPRKLTEREIIDERANDLATALKTDKDSPFYQRIVVTTSPRAGQISSTNFIRKVSPLIKRQGRLSGLTDSERAGVLNNLYRGIAHVFPDEYRAANSVFFRTVGFGALMNVLPEILDAVLNIRSKFRVVDVISVLEEIDDFDFGSWRQMGTGSAAESQAAEDLRAAIQGHVASKGGTIQLE